MQARKLIFLKEVIGNLRLKPRRRQAIVNRGLYLCNQGFTMEQANMGHNPRP